MNNFNRKLFPGLFLVIFFLLTACGELATPMVAPAAPVSPTSTPKSTTQIAASPMSQISPTAGPIVTPKATVTPVQVMQTMDGSKLQQLSPNTSSSGPVVNGIIEARSTKGILWIKLPEFKFGGPNAGWPYWPLGDYKVYYRASDASTDQLLKTFPAVAEPSTPPCQTCELYNYLELTAPAVDNHFLVGMRIMTPNAQNGAGLQFWWFEPETQTVKLVLTGPEEAGGGRFSVEAHNDKWLFFNQYRTSTNPVVYATDDAHAFVVNLLTGEKREVQLGDENVAKAPVWKADGKLYFAVRDATGNLNDRVLDPQTGVVSPAG